MFTLVRQSIKLLHIVVSPWPKGQVLYSQIHLRPLAKKAPTNESTSPKTAMSACFLSQLLGDQALVLTITADNARGHRSSATPTTRSPRRTVQRPRAPSTSRWAESQSREGRLRLQQPPSPPKRRDTVKDFQLEERWGNAKGSQPLRIPIRRPVAPMA